MKVISPGRLLAIAALGTAVLLPPVQSAGGVEINNDHLKCFSAKDKRDIPTFPNVTLTPLNSPFPIEEGCEIRPKAREYCTRVSKNPTNPPIGINLTFDYLCYKVICDKDGFNETINLGDQFGSGQVTVSKKRVKKLCTPTITSNPS